MRTIYMDESGQTGTRLLDEDQRIFSIGSTDLNEGEAVALLRETLPKHADGDLKFRNLIRRRGNHQALMSFAEAAGRIADRFHGYVADKQFATLGRMVDWLVEPIAHDKGYDFYAGDYARKYTNSFWFSFEAAKQIELREALLQAYERFARAPTHETLVAFEAACVNIHQRSSGIVENFVGMVLTGLRSEGLRLLVDDAPEMNDIHVTCVVQTTAWWSSRTDSDLELIHDESKHFFQRAGIWERISALSVGSLDVTVGEKGFGLPLRVARTLPGNSADLPSLKVCDLIAGFGAKIVEGPRDATEQGVLDAMVDAGMGNVTYHPLRFSGEFASGPPPVATGPDVIDRIASAVGPK